MSVPALTSTTEEFERRAIELIPERALEREVAHCFESCLMKFFSSLPRGNPYSFWAIDDFHLQEAKGNADTLSLLGAAYWLSGGQSCGLVRIDIGLRTRPLLYSFKFFPSIGASQILYVAKMPNEWVLSDAGDA